MKSSGRLEIIEALVRERKDAKAHRAIRRHLQAAKYVDSAVFQACDWYRRLGLYREGFKLVEPKEPLSKISSTEKPQGRRTLWAARFLNLLGAPEFSLPLLGFLSLKSEEDFWIAGNIHLVNFNHREALAHFLEMERLCADRGSYQSRLRRLGAADAWAGQGDFDRSIERAKGIIGGSTEPLLMGIASQALGEYQAKAGEFKKAHQALLKAQEWIPVEDRSTDSAFLSKWLGFTYAKLGKLEESQEQFARAERLLKSLRLRPEAWLDVARLKLSLGMLSEEEANTLIHYPGLSEGFRRLLPASDGAIFGAADSRIQIRLRENEYSIGGSRYYGLPKEILLLAFVRVTGADGLSAVRAKSLLWKDDVYSYLQLTARLEQVLNRLRHVYGISLRRSNGVLSLTKSELNRIGVQAGDSSSPTFLKGKGLFRAREISDYYQISKTQVIQHLNAWITKGWVTRLKKTRATLYRSECG